MTWAQTALLVIFTGKMLKVLYLQWSVATHHALHFSKFTFCRPDTCVFTFYDNKMFIFKSVYPKDHQFDCPTKAFEISFNLIRILIFRVS